MYVTKQFKNKYKESYSLCWRCRHVFNNECQKPVEGWDAIRNDVRNKQSDGTVRYSESYFVIDCPNFDPD